ncbi:hypothetical protein IT575_05125 [bacterium]|nr:hypothetical protein [bacterium]
MNKYSYECQAPLRRLLAPGLLALLLLAALSACSAGAGSAGSVTAAPELAPANLSGSADSEVGAAQFPLALPNDQPQPWDDKPRRRASTFGPDSVLVSGSDYLQASGLFEGKAGDPSVLELDSTPAGGADPLSYALYRLPLGGSEPGAISVDVNLSAAALSPVADSGDEMGLRYWVGVANYASGRWEWHGPMSESAVRIGTAAQVRDGASYLSELGNAFVAVVSYSGPRLEILGIGAAEFDAGDISAPETPAFTAMRGNPGGIDFFYQRLDDPGIAGYQVYYSSQPFTAASKGSARRLAWLDNTSFVAPIDQGLVSLSAAGTLYVAVSAVDLGGNESPLSSVDSAVAGAGQAIQMHLSVDSAEGLVNSSSTMKIGFDRPLAEMEQQLGASLTLAFDLNGDGTIDVEGLSATTDQMTLDTSATGILRPRAYAYTSFGEFVAHGSVSLFISSNAAPQAVLLADRTRLLLSPDKNASLGTISLDMSNSFDPDNGYSLLDFSLDHDGDGVFENISSDQPKSLTYSLPGAWLCTLKATDPAGYSSSASVMIQARMMSSFEAAKEALSNENSSLLSMARETGSGICAALYLEETSLMCVRSLDASCSAWSSPDVVTTGIFSPGRVQILGLSGRFLALYHDQGNLFAIRSNGAGGPWGSPLLLADTGNGNETGEVCSLALVGTVPAAAYFEEEGDGQHKLLYRPASDSAANAWSSAATVQIDLAGVDTSNNDSGLALLEVQGEPAVFYVTDGELLFERRGKLLDVPTWSFGGIILDGSESIGARGLSAARLDGKPAVAYSRNDSSKTMLMRASNDLGSEWNSAQQLMGSSSQSLQLLTLADGNTALFSISNSADSALRFCHSLDAAGSQWTSTGVIRPGASGDACAGVLSSLGQPLVAYFSRIAGGISYDLNCARPVY